MLRCNVLDAPHKTSGRTSNKNVYHDLPHSSAQSIMITKASPMGASTAFRRSNVARVVARGARTVGTEDGVNLEESNKLCLISRRDLG